MGIAARTAQMAYVPRLVAAVAVGTGAVVEIPLTGFEPVAQPLYLSVSKDRVEKYLQKMLMETVGGML